MNLPAFLPVCLLSIPLNLLISAPENYTPSAGVDELFAAYRTFEFEYNSGQSDSEHVEPLDMPEEFTPYRFTVSSRFPVPDLPRDNPLIKERIQLGEMLFFETALSSTGEIACANCHVPELAFSDPNRFSTGVRDRRTRRHSMPLFNLAWKDDFFWDGRSPTLRDQVLHPIQNPNEMGERLDNVTQKLRVRPEYQEGFGKAFGSNAMTPQNIALALEAYLLTLTSYDSKFDQAMKGEAILTSQEQRGFELFMTEFEPRSGHMGADCFHCHGGALFTDNSFHNNGMISRRDRGRYDFTRDSSDVFKFATPSLRNVAVTAPYMHDGRFTTLREVVEHYTKGVHRSETLDPNLAKHPRRGLPLSEDDIDALVAFLETLTDPRYLPPEMVSSKGS